VSVEGPRPKLCRKVNPSSKLRCFDRKLCELTKAIEFSVPRSPQECSPFIRRKPENGAFGVLAVAHADIATGEACHFDAVAV